MNTYITTLILTGITTIAFSFFLGYYFGSKKVFKSYMTWKDGFEHGAYVKKSQRNIRKKR